MFSLKTILLIIFVLLGLYLLYEKMTTGVRFATGETASQKLERQRMSAEMIPSQRIR